MADPDRRLARAYRSYRASEGPTPEQQAEAWAAIMDRISQGDVGPTMDEPEPRRAVVWPWVMVGTAIAAALLLWAVTPMGAGLVDRFAEPTNPDAAAFDAKRSTTPEVAEVRNPPSRRPAKLEQSESAPVEVAPDPSAFVESLPVVEPRPIAVPPVARRTPGVHRQAPRPAPEPPPLQPSIAAEVELLRQAKQALRRGDAERALALIRDHGERHPGGALAPERQLLEVRALCAVGRTDLAESKAEAFVKDNPSSPWAARMRRGCAGPRVP